MKAFEHDRLSTHLTTPDQRPAFCQSKTSDRLRECERIPSMPPTKPRRSVFREEGLEDLEHSVYHSEKTKQKSQHGREREEDEEDVSEHNVTFEGILRDQEHKEHVEHIEHSGNTSKASAPWYAKIGRGARPKVTTAATAPPGQFSTIPRVALMVFLIAVVVPGFRYGGKDKVNIPGADAGVIMRAELVENGSLIEGRQASPTETCTRWSHMTALVNGTLYIYGGQAKTESEQTANTWNNNFMALDLTKTWEISSPSLTGLAQPSGPPAVAMGSLWHSYDSLFLYGGEFSDAPAVSPSPVATWEYNIKSAKWIEYSSPVTSAGNASDDGGQLVQRAAEGAGISVPELGRSWYFGGHLDLFTTPGWSNQIYRLYLRSLLEFTHPGYANDGVQSLRTTTAAPAGGVYRNITEGGLQDEAGFTERADGVLTYVPGWGDDGIILGLAGGTNVSFTEMNIIDVYDIANSEWYKQSTSGPSPPIRVDPCAVVAASPDGTSFNVYLYGGQNLIPFGEQIQYSDMWILTIPSFTWVEVDMTGQSQPPPRAGHTCNLWDGQMVVVGGYVGKNISCDSPGIYVFDTSTLKWTNSFTSLPGSPYSSGSTASDSADGDSSVFQGSYGYQVPGPVQSIIGGSSDGGATATQPAVGSATSGPIATGHPPTFTVTQSGSTVISTAHSTATATVSGSSEQTGSSASSTTKPRSVGVITASVAAGVLAILAAYLAFCTWLYRRQLQVYKSHVAMAQRETFNNSPENSWVGSGSNSGDANNFSVGSGPRMSQIPGGPNLTMLGPFGTTAGSPSGSAGRRSLGAESNSGTQITPADSGQGSFAASGGGGASRYGPYGRLSEEGEDDTEYHGRSHMAPSASVHSSTDDLLSGQEPSFFSVVLNPRRTLRVVNSD